MEVGLIRCLQTEDMCPGTACLKVMKDAIVKKLGDTVKVIDYTH